jgi:polar amino acid transport system substrate-binding protein
MGTTCGLITAILGLMISGCASIHTAPTLEVQQALTPTGKLRVGLTVGGPLKGVVFDLGSELARRMGVPFEAVPYPSIGALLDGAKSGQWDVAFAGVDPERAKYLDFTGPHLEIEFGYLVPGGSPISALADVDRPGVRVVVPERGAADIFFSRALKNAVVVRGSGLAGVLEILKAGRADVFAASKPILFETMVRLPASRVLDGRPGSEQQAMAMPKGRNLGAAYARKFIEDAKSEGLVKAAIERAGVRGAVVAPPE